MPKVIGVKFRTSPRVYWFSPNDGEEYKKDDMVVVETQRGIELATIVELPHDVDESKIVAPLKPVSRVATESDLEAVRADNERKQEILATAKEKVSQRGLDMKIVDCEFTVDHSKLVLYFTAEQRVDFRELVRDLASAFHIRIDLRQIGAREECKLIGSLATCGQPCCCGRFESDSEHVSIKMAKNQNLALTPGKINGMCGRLLCCLAYENKTYEDVMKRAPKHGAWVTAPDGRRGTVVSVTPLTEKVRVRFGNDENFEFADFLLSELNYERNDNAQQKSPENAEKQDKKNAQSGKNKKHGGDKNKNAGEEQPTNKGKNKNNNNNADNNDTGSNNNNGNSGSGGGKNKSRRHGGKNRRGGGRNNKPNGAQNGGTQSGSPE